jgi:S1-C subfamily serine protease
VTVTSSIVASFNLEVDRGILAVHVEPSKLAAQAGLHSGDVITAVDQTQVYNMGDFWHAYLRSPDQTPAHLTVQNKSGQSTVALPRTAPQAMSR